MADSRPDHAAARPETEVELVDALIQAQHDEDLKAELRMHLRNASHVSPRSPSRKALHRLLDEPHVLDYLERLLNADA